MCFRKGPCGVGICRHLAAAAHLPPTPAILRYQPPLAIRPRISRTGLCLAAALPLQETHVYATALAASAQAPHEPHLMSSLIHDWALQGTGGVSMSTGCCLPCAMVPVPMVALKRDTPKLCGSAERVGAAHPAYPATWDTGLHMIQALT